MDQIRNELKEGDIKTLEELLPNRDSKMRRFCNYFLTLFNQNKLIPFTQFVNSKTLQKVKQDVRAKMAHFTGGEKQIKSEKDKKKSDKKKKSQKGAKAQKLYET